MEQAREKFTEPTKEAFTSTYDMILNEGMEKGIEQGIERGIIGLLKKNMSVTFIAEAFEVSKEYVLEIKGRLGL